MHQVIDLLQLTEPNDLERRLDDPTTEELNRLGAVLAVTDVAALDRHHLDDGLEDRGAQVGAGGEADADDCSAWADVL